MVDQPQSQRQTTLIQPHQAPSEYWQTVIAYRELLWFLARRDFVVRYRQTMAGILWLLVRPALQVVMFTFVFGTLAQLPDGGIAYPVLAFSGVITWTLFHAVVQQSALSLGNNRSLVTKIYFPRILLPIGTIVPNLVDLCFNLLALGLLMWFYDLAPSWRIMLLPVPLAMVSAIAVGAGCIASAGSVRYRDFQQLLPYALTFLLFVTPVGFSSAIAAERLGSWSWLVFHANPLVAAIDLFRWCVFPAGYGPPQDILRLVISLASAILLMWFGQWYFRRCERTFADVI